MIPRLLSMIGCAVLIATLLPACGWQLQGARRIPEEIVPLYLELNDSQSLFAAALRQRLRLSGVAVTTDPTRARAVLNVMRDLSGHHVSSVSALNEPQQYEVYYHIEYRLDRHGGETANLLAPQNASLSRTMSYDKTLALAKQREERLVHETLAGELADQVMRRLSLLPALELNHQAAAPDTQ